MQRHVLLTFDTEPPSTDDGYSGARILDTLASRGIKATFFVQGAWVERYPELVRRLRDEGHCVGNHTYHHVRVDELSPDELAREVEQTANSLAPYDINPRPYFRCPQNAGGWDAGVAHQLNELGYRHIHWNAESWDWHEKGDYEAALNSIDEAFNHYEPVVILLHSWTNFANEELDKLLDHLDACYAPHYLTVAEADEAKLIIDPMDYGTVQEPGTTLEEPLSGETIQQQSLGSSVAWGLIAKVASVVANFVFGIMIARTLGPDGKGSYALVQQFVSILVILLSLGLPTSNVFFVASGKISPQRALSQSLALLLPTTVIAFCATLLYLVSPFRGRLQLTVVLLVTAVVLFALLLLSSWLSAVRTGQIGIKPQSVSILVSSLIIIVGALGLFLMGKATVIAFLWVTCAGQIGAVTVLWAWPHAGSPHLSFSWTEFKSMLGYSLKAQLLDIAMYLHLRQDVLILGWLSSDAEVGMYSVAVSFAEMVRFVPQIVGNAFFPLMSAQNKEEQEIKTGILSRCNVAFSFLFSLVMCALVPLFIPLFFGKAFVPAIVVALILIPGAFFTSISELPATLLFAREKIYWKIALSTTVLNIIINIVVIPFWGAPGAALASTVTYSCYGFGLLYLTKKETGLSYGSLMIMRRSDIALIKKKLRSRQLQGKLTRDNRSHDE